MQGEVTRRDRVAVLENPLQLSPYESSRQETPRRTPRDSVLDGVYEPAAFVVLRLEAVNMVPGGKRARHLPIRELSRRVHGAMLGNPAV